HVASRDSPLCTCVRFTILLLSSPLPHPPPATLVPYTTLFRSRVRLVFMIEENDKVKVKRINFIGNRNISDTELKSFIQTKEQGRSEEHTSELQSRDNLVCRLLLEQKT